MIRAKKFYATLPHKLDAAIAELGETQPTNDDLWAFTEELEGDTPLGGEMRVSIKSVTKLNKDDRNNE